MLKAGGCVSISRAKGKGVKVLFLTGHDPPDAQSSGWKEPACDEHHRVNQTRAILSYIDCLLTGSYFNSSVSIFLYQHEMPHILYTKRQLYPS